MELDWLHVQTPRRRKEHGSDDEGDERDTRDTPPIREIYEASDSDNTRPKVARDDEADDEADDDGLLAHNPTDDTAGLLTTRELITTVLCVLFLVASLFAFYYGMECQRLSYMYPNYVKIYTNYDDDYNNGFYDPVWQNDDGSRDSTPDDGCNQPDCNRR